jgi:hypothetical protein
VYGTFCLVAATAARSQTAAPAFEVATIKPSVAPIENLLAQACRIKNFQISGPEGCFRTWWIVR